MTERELKELVNAVHRLSGQRRVDAVVGDLEEAVGGAGGPDVLHRAGRRRFVAAEKAAEVHHRGVEIVDGGGSVALRPDECLGYAGLVPEDRRVEDDAPGASVSLLVEVQGSAQEDGGGVAVHEEEEETAECSFWVRDWKEGRRETRRMWRQDEVFVRGARQDKDKGRDRKGMEHSLGLEKGQTPPLIALGGRRVHTTPNY